MSRQGFTLIELAAILAILLILAIALVPRITANRASTYYAEAQTLGVAVAQSVSNYLVQDPERTPADLAGQLGLAPITPPTGAPGGYTYYDCSGGADLNPAVRWAARSSAEIMCALGVLPGGASYRVVTWWTQNPDQMYLAP